ncbi:glycosyltransferase family 4 protein [Roseobacter sp. HKCCA0882]|uniref:glycosyltransferase family 4 protein n=1 Tax=Roseobacter sp. HKCCA0882 TaxID=3120337 RepID=UPI0030EC9BFC
MTTGVLEGLDDLGLEHFTVVSGKQSGGLIADEMFGGTRFWLAVIIDTVKILKKCILNKVSYIIVIPEYHLLSAFFVSQIIGSKVIIYGAGTYSLKAFKKSSLLFKLARRRVLWRVMSEYTKKRISKYDNSVNLTVVGAGVGKKIYQEVQKIKNPKKAFDLIFVGNLKPRKGFKTLSSALDLFVGKHPDVNLNIIMPGGYTEGQTSSIREILPTVNFYFPGVVSDCDLIKLYGTAKVNILLSHDIDDHFEGYGLVHREAMMSGTYTIGSLESGNTDAILPEYGLSVDPNDVHGLVTILEEIFDNPPTVPIGSGFVQWKNVVADMMVEGADAGN